MFSISKVVLFINAIVCTLLEGFSTGILFFNSGNFACGVIFAISLFDICQVEDLQFIRISSVTIESRIKIIEIYYESGGSAEYIAAVSESVGENPNLSIPRRSHTEKRCIAIYVFFNNYNSNKY